MSEMFKRIEKLNLFLILWHVFVIIFIRLINYLSIEGVGDMNYNKLWKLLIDRNLKKKDLREMAGLTTNVMAKMGKGGDVSTNVLRKICEALNCQLYDIVEFESDMNR